MVFLGDALLFILGDHMLLSAVPRLAGGDPVLQSDVPLFVLGDLVLHN